MEIRGHLPLSLVKKILVSRVFFVSKHLRFLVLIAVLSAYELTRGPRCKFDWPSCLRRLQTSDLTT